MQVDLEGFTERWQIKSSDKQSIILSWRSALEMASRRMSSGYMMELKQTFLIWQLRPEF